MPTINKLFGVADPQYDALRVQSNQAVWPDAGGAPVIGAGGIENKIYVWHADGSTIDLFDPDAAGLALALAAAASGDTVWLPSIPIACTAAITVPASVALTGISHDAILTFTGFATAAVTLSTNSIMEHFTLTHSDGIGFDASASGAKVIDMIVTADQPGTVGYDVVVDEIWVMSNGALGNDSLCWSNYTRSGSRVWNKVASLPGTPMDFAVADDGSAVYLQLASDQSIYKCTNPKAGSPTWTQIAYLGLSTGLGTITGYLGYQIGPITIQGTTLITTAGVGAHTWIYGTYNGTSWTWSSESNANIFRPSDVGLDSWAGSQFLYDGAHSLVEDLGFDPNNARIWHRTGARRYVATVHVATNNVAIRLPGEAWVDVGGFTTGSQITATSIRGAHGGLQVYCVSGVNGHLFLSNNGLTFSDIATWAIGYVEDDVEAGGGNLIWIKASVLQNAEMGRAYSRAGAVLDDLTGNFWSIVYGSDQTIVGMGIVYV